MLIFNATVGVSDYHTVLVSVYVRASATQIDAFPLFSSDILHGWRGGVENGGVVKGWSGWAEGNESSVITVELLLIQADLILYEVNIAGICLWVTSFQRLPSFHFCFFFFLSILQVLYSCRLSWCACRHR